MLANDSPKPKDRAEYLKAYRAANREKHAEYQRAYREANRETLKKKAAQHYQDNAQVYKDRARQWAENNPEKRSAVASDWRKSHPNVYLEASRRGYQKHREKRVEECRLYREENPEKMRAAQAAWHEKNPGANAHHVGLRRTRLMHATPQWADARAMKDIYKKAAELNRQGDQVWHVDHEIPLRHPLVCGLHNEFNLRLLPASENLSKRNKFSV